MSDVKRIYLDEISLIRDKSSSDGAQTKYYSDNQWFKVDYYGGEAESECLATLLLDCTNLDKNSYVQYEKIMINESSGCVSRDFRKNDEAEFITLYRLYKNISGRDLAAVTSKMDFDDAIMYVIDFVKKQTGLDITRYLANTFWLDSIILNTDRHFNNYGVIMRGDEFREAPIFDNGKSLLTGMGVDLQEVGIENAVRKCYSKSFSPNFDLNADYLKQYCTISLDERKLQEVLATGENTVQMQVLKYQLVQHGYII